MLKPTFIDQEEQQEQEREANASHFTQRRITIWSKLSNRKQESLLKRLEPLNQKKSLELPQKESLKLLNRFKKTSSHTLKMLPTSSLSPKELKKQCSLLLLTFLKTQKELRRDHSWLLKRDMLLLKFYSMKNSELYHLFGASWENYFLKNLQIKSSSFVNSKTWRVLHLTFLRMKLRESEISMNKQSHMDQQKDTHLKLQENFQN